MLRRLLVVCLFSTSLTTYSQSPHPSDHWWMTEDQMVHGPFPEFAKMWANRMVADSQIRKASIVIASQSVIIRNQSELLADKDRIITNDSTIIKKQQEKNNQITQDLVNCVDDNGKLKGWAKAGKWGAGILSGGAILGAAVIVKNTFFP